MEIYNESGDLLGKTDSNGLYKFTYSKPKLTLIYFNYGFEYVNLYRPLESVLPNKSPNSL